MCLALRNPFHITPRCARVRLGRPVGPRLPPAIARRGASGPAVRHWGPGATGSRSAAEGSSSMSAGRFDVVIVGGGSAGSALANRLSADPGTRVLLLEAGRPDYPWDVFVHMPAALTFPIGSRFYDWRYESEPEPHMNGRRIYHARGKVLGGSSSINGMIFQRGNPMDFERWAADPGMGTWDYAHCLPYFQPDGDLPGSRRGRSLPRPFRPAGPGAGPGDGPAVRGLLPGRAGGGLPADGRRERRTGRRASPRSTATCATAGGCPPRGPTCTRSAHGPTSPCRPGPSSPGSSSRAGARPASRWCAAPGTAARRDAPAGPSGSRPAR